MKLGLTMVSWLSVFFIATLNAQIHQAHEHVIFIEYNSSCMNKLDYRVDHGFIIDDNHAAFHVKLDAQRTLVLKVLNKDKAIRQLPSTSAKVFDCNALSSIDESFVVGINGNTTKVYLMEGKGNSKLYHYVSFAEYNVENNRFLSSFAPPLHSFVYEINEAYDPLQPLHPVGFDAFDYNTRTFYFGADHEKAENKHVFLSVYRDVCANRPFGIVTPRTNKGEDNPYKFQDINGQPSITTTNGTKKILRSCQHPVQITYLKGIGLMRKSYEEDGKVYGAELIRVNGVALEDYLSNAPKNATLVNHLPPEQPIYWEYKPKRQVAAIKKSTPQSYNTNITLKSPTKTTQFTEKNVGADFGELVNYQPKKTAAIKKIPQYIATKAKEEVSKKEQLLVHVVRKGDTVYNLSKKYGMTIDELKTINQLEDMTIMIGQELFVK